MSKSKSTEGGISATFILFLVFLVLKLTHSIDWSWWWVTAPLWAPIISVFAILGIAFIFVVIAGLLRFIFR